MLAKKTPTWLLERAAQGELDANEVQQVRARLAAEGRALESELEGIADSNREILGRLPRHVMGAAIRKRAQAAHDDSPRARRRAGLLLAPLALVGSVAAVILVVRAVGPATPVPLQEKTEIKGNMPVAPRLLVYRQRPAQGLGPDGSERLSDGAQGERGDLLQLAYDKAADRIYGTLVSIDGAGRVTQHLPEEGALESALLTPVREVHLPSAYELDDAPGFERFFLITAAKPFPVNVVLAAARAVASRAALARTLPLSLDANFHQTSLLLTKTPKGTP